MRFSTASQPLAAIGSVGEWRQDDQGGLCSQGDLLCLWLDIHTHDEVGILHAWPWLLRFNRFLARSPRNSGTDASGGGRSSSSSSAGLAVTVLKQFLLREQEISASQCPTLHFQHCFLQPFTFYKQFYNPTEHGLHPHASTSCSSSCSSGSSCSGSS